VVKSSSWLRNSKSRSSAVPAIAGVKIAPNSVMNMTMVFSLCGASLSIAPPNGPAHANGVAV
jgi:hypothetical protein